ncbi:MAG: hypothetical protein ACRCUY_05450, partial [Thermoguttaceae bacterium]
MREYAPPQTTKTREYAPPQTTKTREYVLPLTTKTREYAPPLTTMIIIFLLFAWLLCSLMPNNLVAQLHEAPILFTKQYNYQGLHIYDTFYQWRPGGGIYVLENPADPPEKHRVRPIIDATTAETLGDGVYFDISLSYDAKKILFSFKGTSTGNSTIYEIGIDGKGLRQITNLDKNGNPYLGNGTGHHDVNPCYLPDDRIVFCSTRYSGLVPCANNGVAIMHVMNNDGSDIHTISVNNVTEFDPFILSDGRILYGRWEYIDKNALTIQSLWTVMPDGTNENAVYANNMVFPEAVLQAKPIPHNEHLIVATLAPHNAPPRGSIAIIDTRLGKNDPKALFNFEHPENPTFDRGESCDPWPLDENTIIYSGIPNENDAPVIDNNTPAGKRSNPKLNAIMLIDRSGKKSVVLSDSTFDLHHPIPIVPRPRPMIVADTTNRNKIEGNFFVSNVYEGMPSVEKGSVKWLRVVEETSRVSESPGGTRLNQTFSISAALSWSPKIYHGIVPVSEDGSAYFTAPSGRALSFQLLDDDYRLVRSMRTFVQAAPGTTRSCVGCHEYKYSAATSIDHSRLLTQEPMQLKDESWGSGYLDYSSMIQPILDDKCVKCHGGEDGFAKGIDLSGGWTELFNTSYESLTARRTNMGVADLIQGICCMNGTAYWSCKLFEPYQHGSGNAPLADILLSESHLGDTSLTQAERELLLTWIDSNGLYFGTWNYTKAGAHSQGAIAAKQAVSDIMKKSACVECHSDEQGNIRRFDNWINLAQPKMSRVLRAPLDPNAKDGFGVGFCRNRKMDQTVSRLGVLASRNYAHAVIPLADFPKQIWPDWDENQQGEPVITFASTDDPVYQQILIAIESARAAQLAAPRVDMPGANEVGEGIIAGRFRQIIPQPLPVHEPTCQISVDAAGFVRIYWERSSRTIGLVTEIHRSTERADFVPNSETLLKRTELFEYTDKEPPVGQTVYYALVLTSDPATTCGTLKSGAVLQFGGNLQDVSFVPDRGSIESRCPLSDFKPISSPPIYRSVDVPVPAAPTAPRQMYASVFPGYTTLIWDIPVPGGVYSFMVSRRTADGKLIPILDKPIVAGSTMVATPEDANEEFVVQAIGRGGISDANTSVKVTTKKPNQEPVYVLGQLSKDGNPLGTIHGNAALTGQTLDLQNGGWLVIPANNDYSIHGGLTLEFDVTFSESGEMPVLVSHGKWRQSGWFLQKFGKTWRFHVAGTDC